MTYSVKEDSAGLDMWYKWITSACTLTGVAHWEIQGLREVQVVREQTGEALLTRTCYGWGSLGKKQRSAQNRSEWRRSVAQCIHL